MAKKNKNEIDTTQEAAVEITKIALKKNNFWKVTIWLGIIAAVIISFFAYGGLNVFK